MKYLRYFWYLVRHRWFVFVACCRVGLVWRGLVHDLSKFRPSEFIPYANFFASWNPRDKSGYYKPTNTGNEAFDRAWLLHVHRNDHHWQHWVVPDDEWGRVFDIPDVALREMVCDWEGAAKAQRSEVTVAEWWCRNSHWMRLTKGSIERIKELLGGD